MPRHDFDPVMMYARSAKEPPRKTKLRLCRGLFRHRRTRLWFTEVRRHAEPGRTAASPALIDSAESLPFFPSAM